MGKAGFPARVQGVRLPDAKGVRNMRRRSGTAFGSVEGGGAAGSRAPARYSSGHAKSTQVPLSPGRRPLKTGIGELDRRLSAAAWCRERCGWCCSRETGHRKEHPCLISLEQACRPTAPVLYVSGEERIALPARSELPRRTAGTLPQPCTSRRRRTRRFSALAQARKKKKLRPLRPGGGLLQTLELFRLAEALSDR